MSQKSHWRIRVGVWGCALFVSLQFVIAQNQIDPKTHQFKLSQIIFQGLTATPQEKAIEFSGLKIGQTVTLENLTAALQQMRDHGQISEGRYSYKYQGDDLEVTFIVKEANGSLTVLFDNFIWFTREEIDAKIRLSLPSYDGKIVDASASTIQNILEKMLQEKNIKGRVESEGGFGSSYIFRVTDVPMPVCNIKFLATQAFTEKELTSVLNEIVNADYSLMTDRIIARDRLIPFYRQHGYLKIKIGAITGSVASEDNCKKEMSQATIKLDEGAIYKWNGITFTGNQVISSDKLIKMFPLKQNDVADGVKIDKAFIEALSLYHNVGYFKAKLPANPVFDDTAQTVSYNVEITEGQRYNFGQLSLKGLTQEVSTQFLTKWQELQGKPYDAKAFSTFVTEALRKINSRTPPQVDNKLQDDTLSINFVIDFTR